MYTCLPVAYTLYEFHIIVHMCVCDGMIILSIPLFLSLSEFFGEEKVLSGDEERRSEEKEADSDQEEMTSRQSFSSYSPR